MSNEQAKELLKKCYCAFIDTYSPCDEDEYREAFDIAIASLCHKCEICGSCENCYVSISLPLKYRCKISDEYVEYYQKCNLGFIPIIRCGECKHYQGNHDVPGCAPCDFWGIGAVMWDDYCSRGEVEG